MTLRIVLSALIPSLCFERLRCLIIDGVSRPEAAVVLLGFPPDMAEALQAHITEFIDAQREDFIAEKRQRLEEEFNNDH